jgi:aminomethyltransferase
MANRTPLYDEHVAAKAKIVDFAGWDMPLHYGSQLDEHHIVRTTAGMFDVSHMLAVDVIGKETQGFLRYILANDVAKLPDGKALYTCMLKSDGGIIDDLIVYAINPSHYRIVVNAGRREVDLAWLKQQAQSFSVNISPRLNGAIIAVQGPQARELAAKVLPSGLATAALALSPFSAVLAGEWLVARTGYTGEDGFEILLPANEVVGLWQALLKVGVRPCGLGARDTLRLEAGMNLYGSDMDESLSPLETGLAWTVVMAEGRDFIGRAALTAQQIKQKQVGLVLTERGVLRGHQKVHTKAGVGEITSGTFSPTLGIGIAMARVPAATELGEICEVEIRDKRVPARIVKLPFVRKGKKVFEQEPC